MRHGDVEATLGFLVEQVLGPTEDDYLVEAGGKKKRALRNWYRLNDQYERFNCLLSDHQRQSYNLIHDWWTASYCDAAIMLASVLSIVDSCDGDIQPADEELETFTNAFGRLAMKRWPPPGVEIKPEVNSGRGHTTYNQAIRDLYHIEFERHPLADPAGDVALHIVRENRKHAVMHAWCQASAWRYLISGLEEPKSNNIPLEKQQHYHVDLSQAIETCSWLNAPKEDQLPYYLWHRKSKKTVPTASIEGQVHYTCVSHTWGRWRKETSIRLPGVPWAIPENSQFEVSDLPSILDAVPTKTEYVWFDLVCIPQDGSPIANSEIARQAQIFKGAKEAVAWANDVEDFEALSCTLRWLMLQILSVSPGTDLYEHRKVVMTEELQQLGERPSNLLTSVLNGSHWFDYSRSPNVWFTSLWTLQELCLRPDMKLCARNWRALTLVDDAPTEIGGIVSIFRACEKAYDGLIFPDMSFRDMNPAFWELDWWLRSTGLDQLLSLSRTNIVAWGDQRQCTSRRAEAIMSALGVTGWYDPSEAGTEDDQCLVLGKYPINFIEELVQLNPAEFFCSGVRSKTITNDEKYVEAHEYDDDLTPSPALQARLEGLLLPFSATNETDINFGVAYSQKFVSHPSLFTWEVRTSGEVEVPRACIIASSKPAFQPAIDFTVGVGFSGIKSRNAPTISGLKMDSYEAFDQGIDIDLQEWAATRSYEVHAVVCASTYTTLYDEYIEENIRREIPRGIGRSLEGLLLCRVSDTHYAKLAGFYAAEFEEESTLPEAVDVNWLVL